MFFLSLLSLFVAIFSAYQTRKNNRLSKLPIGYILPRDYEEEISVTLQNNGTGPLITNSIQFIDENDNVKNALIEFMPSLKEPFVWETFRKQEK